MRIRIALPTITAATALVTAAALAIPAAAYADTHTGTRATTAAASDTAPSISGALSLKTDQGFALIAYTTGDVDHVNFILTEVSANGAAGPKTTITVNQPSSDGSGRPAGPSACHTATITSTVRQSLPTGPPARWGM
ncbi:hypothetical protein GXW82_21320 [Streptacidiphilus sp. 4-A2]|nr:hypothetical protein [Streptacidiphilus sp. 4-A2]